jgi:hypothetical protein
MSALPYYVLQERKSLRNSVIALVDGGAGAQPFTSRGEAGV